MNDPMIPKNIARECSVWDYVLTDTTQHKQSCLSTQYTCSVREHADKRFYGMLGAV